ncbi:MAG: DUF3127 domain-containing protein [Verrucomicrobiaceae bacterium]|nr:MAG: DUF3127 domain-containing protein [Verrucomicrobiaceae bacterium]
MYEASGKIKMIGDVQSFASGFTKREFVVTTSNDKYPQDIKFDLTKDKCAVLDSFHVGDDVQVTFDIRGREYNGKYYVDLSCWKLQGANGGGSDGPAPRGQQQGGGRNQQAAPQGEPSMSDLRNDDDFDDVPF